MQALGDVVVGAPVAPWIPQAAFPVVAIAFLIVGLGFTVFFLKYAADRAGGRGAEGDAEGGRDGGRGGTRERRAGQNFGCAWSYARARMRTRLRVLQRSFSFRLVPVSARFALSSLLRGGCRVRCPRFAFGGGYCVPFYLSSFSPFLFVPWRGLRSVTLFFSSASF